MLLQRPHQGRIRETTRRLGEMLLGEKILEVEGVSISKIR